MVKYGKRPLFLILQHFWDDWSFHRKFLILHLVNAGFQEGLPSDPHLVVAGRELKMSSPPGTPFLPEQSKDLLGDPEKDFPVS